MSATPLSLECKPRLASKAKLRLDAKSGKYVLLYPEKGLVLNPTGAAILKLCQGEQPLSAIIATLAEQFGTDAQVLQPEVLAFVNGLFERGLLQAEP